MLRILRASIVSGLALLAIIGLSQGLAAPVAAKPASTCDPDILLPSGAYVRNCLPSEWNGTLVVYAHGYVNFNQPITIPENQLQLPGGISLPDLITSLGFAFATTSYRTNGLAVENGVADLVDVVNTFSATYPITGHVLLAGVSEGGLITTLAIEQRPDVFDGGLATCGPIGDFSRQIDYFGDFRVLFDYFYPGLLPGSPISIPTSLIDAWPYYYTATLQPIIFAPTNTAKLDQLLQVSHAPYISGLITTVDKSVFDALDYSVMATNDGFEKLGGQAFDNHDRVYAGSMNDGLLNQTVPRFTAEVTAVNTLNALYQTTGLLSVPLVTLHTALDQQVPYWHEPLYRAKVILNDSLAFHQNITVNGYGHCAFSGTAALNAFAQLLTMVYSPTARYASPRVFLPTIAGGN